MQIDEITNRRMRHWIYSKGVYNCIIAVGDQHFRVDVTLGVSPATPEEIATFPLYPAPEWFSFTSS